MSEQNITIFEPLSLRTSYAFPLQTKESKKEVLWGAALLVLLPGIGWLLNMGHRIIMVHNMQHGRDAWPAWVDYGALLKHGTITFLGMVYYYLPSLVLAAIAYQTQIVWLYGFAGVLFLGATVAIPGYMSHYCWAFDTSEIYNPLKALSRVKEGGLAYWKAWGIALSALALSFLGLLGVGVFFFVSSVWFWQVAGFSFASVFSQKFQLKQ